MAPLSIVPIDSSKALGDDRKDENQNERLSVPDLEEVVQLTSDNTGSQKDLDFEGVTDKCK